MQLNLPKFEIDDEQVTYNPIHRDKATFKSGTTQAVHNWFRLTPSFGPDLVRIVLDEFNYNKNSIVLDPFAGASTTLIECQLMNLKAYGFEINPFLHYVGKTTLNWDLSHNKIDEIKSKILSSFSALKKKYQKNEVEQLPFPIPTIHNVFRWWRKDVLKDLVLLKNAIIDSTSSFGDDYRDFFYLCLAGVLVPDLTNVTLGKLQLHFMDRSDDKIEVLPTYIKHLDKMIDDLKCLVTENHTNRAIIFHTDSTVLENISINDKIDFVITSPPYPNRYSYVWNTRPFLFFFDFFSSPKSASDLDQRTIGGTWGTATSVLSKGIIPPFNEAVDSYVKPITDQIRISDNLMANYVMKYFNLLSQQIIAMDKYLSSSAKVAYVVGNSEIKGVYVETDVILSKIFKSIGCNYKQTKLNRFRKRNSGQNLYESIVYGEK